MKRYELTTNTRTVYGRTVYQIRALVSFGSVKAGDLGGWIESENNLQQDGDGWVFQNGLVIWGGQILGGEILGGEIRGGEIRGGQIWGGVIGGGVISGGEIWGGQIWGGVISGGVIWGGQILGGEILGGEIRGGEILGDTTTTKKVFAASQINGYSLTVTDNHISWGCKTLEIKAWFKLTKKEFLAFGKGTTEHHWKLWLATKSMLKIICDDTGRVYK